jgi:hypothetical protein
MKQGFQNSNSEEIKQMIMSLIPIEEDIIIDEIIKSQLEEKEKTIGSLEVQIVSLRKYMQYKSIRILDQIINNQIPSNNRS